MTLEIFIVFALLAAALVLFALEWLSVDLVTWMLLAALVLLGILTPQEAFSGFANEVVVILASIFVVAGVLVKTGVMEWLGSVLYRLGRKSESRTLAYIMGLSAAISSLLSNTNATAILMPATFELSRKGGFSPARLLIPLAYASMLGGTCTLIGTSTNLAASGLMRKLGLAPISMFELTPIGLLLVAAGIGYVILLGRRLLPRETVPSLSETYDLRRYLAEIAVPPRSKLAGQTLEEARLAERGLNVLAVRRGSRRLWPDPGGALEEGDVLVVQATREKLLEAKDSAELTIRAGDRPGDKDLVSKSLGLVEAIIMPQSHHVGRTLRQLDFRHRFRISVLAIYRRGHGLPTGIEDLPLRVGDVLLLEGAPEQFAKLQRDLDLWVLGEVAHVPFRKRRGTVALVALGLAILVGSLGLVPVSVALLLAALAMVLTKSIDPHEAYAFVEWRLIVLIGGMTSFGLAMQKTQAADYLAGLVVDWVLPLGITFVLATFALLTMLLTQPMSNAAAALVVLPVAVSTATRLDLEPRSLAILVALSASLSFIAPFEPACLLVYGPGKYRFVDFLKVGTPLSVVVFAVLLLLVPVLWPL